MTMQLLVGADPELFLKENGIFHSGYGVIPGDKKHPYPVKDGAVQIDGMAVEFNIDPADTEQKFVHNIESVMQQLRGMIPDKFSLEISPVAHFSDEHMTAQPEDAKRLGCDPDYDAYTGEANPRPEQHPTMRTAAGHVHLGWCKDRNPQELHHFLSCQELVKQLDIFLGLPSVILDPDTERKKMYGKAGAFRPKPYGLEYRVMSNFWLKDEKLMRLVYHNTQVAFNRLVSEGRIAYESKKFREIINNNDKDLARKWCGYLGVSYGVK